MCNFRPLFGQWYQPLFSHGYDVVDTSIIASYNTLL